MIPSAKKPGLSSPRQYPQSLSERLPLCLSFPPGLSAAGRGIRGRSLQRKSCKVHWPHRIAQHASTTLYKGELFMTHSSPPPQLGKKCCLMLIAVYTERRDQCQVSFPLAIPRTPRAP